VSGLYLMLAWLTVNSQLPTSNPQNPSAWELFVGHWEFQAQPPAPAQRHGRLFPPADLGLLEAPDRATWQRPDQIMDALKIAERARVADIGAGAGWFTIRLADRVGPNGKVYAQDIQRQMLQSIERRVSREGFRNVETRLGTAKDEAAGRDYNPNLPIGELDAVLVVDSYQEVDPEDRVDFLRRLAASLKPNGRIGIVNYKPGRSGPGPDVRIDSATVEENARQAGLLVLSRANLPYQYLLVLGRVQSVR
jgi:SAM-dependent methyltransferase